MSGDGRTNEALLRGVASIDLRASWLALIVGGLVIFAVEAYADRQPVRDTLAGIHVA